MARPRRRIIVAVVTGDAGTLIQTWRERHDPRQAHRLPVHATLCYDVPEIEPSLVERQVRHAFSGGLTVELGGVRVLDNEDRTIYVEMLGSSQLDRVRRRLYDSRYVALADAPGRPWYVTCVRRSRDGDHDALFRVARRLAPLGRWRIDRVAYMELHSEQYEPIAWIPLP